MYREGCDHWWTREWIWNALMILFTHDSRSVLITTFCAPFFLFSLSDFHSFPLSLSLFAHFLVFFSFSRIDYPKISNASLMTAKKLVALNFDLFVWIIYKYIFLKKKKKCNRKIDDKDKNNGGRKRKRKRQNYSEVERLKDVIKRNVKKTKCQICHICKVKSWLKG